MTVKRTVAEEIIISRNDAPPVMSVVTRGEPHCSQQEAKERFYSFADFLRSSSVSHFCSSTFYPSVFNEDIFELLVEQLMITLKIVRNSMFITTSV